MSRSGHSCGTTTSRHRAPARLGSGVHAVCRVAPKHRGAWRSRRGAGRTDRRDRESRDDESCERMAIHMRASLSTVRCASAGTEPSRVRCRWIEPLGQPRLLVSQGPARIDARRAHGGNQAGRDRHGREQQRHRRECRGSVGSMWKSSDPDSASAPPRRRDRPQRRWPRAGRPDNSTSATTSRGVAPRALRMPISRVRSATLPASTPKMPATASSRAAAANAPNSTSASRRCAVDAAISCIHRRDLEDGLHRSIDAAAARTVVTNASGSPRTRTMRTCRMVG